MQMIGIDPVTALQADHDAVLAVARSLSPEEWAAESGCPGWTVQDIVSHLATLFWLVVDPSVLPDPTGLATEAAQDQAVASRRGWSADQVLADYATVGAKAIEAVRGLVGLPDLVLPMGDLGTYAAPTLVTAFNFDHYTHLRADLLAPRGPVERPVPPSDELRMGPVVAWILAALPQQCAALLAALPGPVVLDLTGPAGGRHRIDSSGVRDDRGEGDALATITCSTSDLAWWVTGRASWEQLGVYAIGAPAALAAVRDHVHVF